MLGAKFGQFSLQAVSLFLGLGCSAVAEEPKVIFRGNRLGEHPGAFCFMKFSCERSEALGGWMPAVCKETIQGERNL